VMCRSRWMRRECRSNKGPLRAGADRLFDAHRLMIELRSAQKLNTGLLEADGSVLLGLTIWQRVEVSSRPLLPPVSLAERLALQSRLGYDQIHRHIEGLR